MIGSFSRLGVFVFTSLLAIPQFATAWQEEPKIDFAKEIQPILARRCYSCHGPGHAEGGLRLHQRDGAVAKLDSGATAVVAEKPAESELIRRIVATDDDVRMPPKSKPISAKEVELLTTWIKQGAKWEAHWAFEPPQRPALPEVKNKAWIRNPVDAFILATLEANGLSPNPLAEKAALIRRLYYDLTGLPPSPQEVADFVADASPQAYEKVVDRLLASPHYGERWARHWLDVVRFAETNSFERDGDKPHAWRFRDYVIRSLNTDKPYNQFIKEQLAGDEMPNPSPDALVATGFYRMGLWDDEPADRLLAKFDGLDDIVTTAGQGFLGLTLNCARCHDHKIDPITQKDYYAFVSFFHNITPMSNGGPQVERPLFSNAEAKQRFDEQVAAQRAKQDALQGQVSAVEKELKEKLAQLEKVAALGESDLEELEYRFYRDTWTTLPNFDELKAETVAKLPANRFDITPATRPDHFGFVYTGILKVPQDGEYSFSLDSDDGSRLVIDGTEILKYDGIHGVGQPKQAKVKLKQGRRAIRLDYFQGAFGKGLIVKWSGPGVEERLLSATASEAEPENRRDFVQLLRKKGSELLGKERVAEYFALKQQLDKATKEKPEAEFALCVSEAGKTAPETFILGRGNPGSPGAKVEPSFPDVLGGGHPDLTKLAALPNSTGRRTALADWIASPENRLTSRVMVNRLWQHHFGRGIVRSPNNFGLLGETPTHRELLDWLATELVRLDWKLKPLHKLLVMSNTYQQSSAGNPAGLAKDPANQWFWRFNMRRLSAEELRDSIHAVNGTLNPKMYGPSIFADISKEVLAGQSQPGQGWGKSPADEQARRSIYIKVKRSLVTPLLATFDFPDSDISCEARFNTVQPGQALSLLNGDFANEQAVIFAARVKKEGGDNPTQQVTTGLQLTLSRPPTEKEIARGVQLMNDLQVKYKLTPEQALKTYCLWLFNLNEFLFLD
jgi:hypothetical protein